MIENIGIGHIPREATYPEYYIYKPIPNYKFVYLHEDLFWRDSTISYDLTKPDAFWKSEEEAKQVIKRYKHKQLLGENEI